MPAHELLIAAVVVLLAAVTGILLAERLKLGPVLGYLVAGLVVGPAGLDLVGDAPLTHTLAELGVTFLLFAVGLELPVERIRLMRGGPAWLGLCQMLVTALAIGLAALALGLDAGGAIVVGGALALSSTAIVLRLLSERTELNSRFGRACFTVLLMQDLMVGPLIVIVLALGGESLSLAPALGLALGKAALATVAILGIGRFALPLLFRPVAATRNAEAFAVLTLLVVICAGMATEYAGLSMAFGALLAGVLLAESAYRHQVGVAIEPFRGLLLGLFFMTVGMSLDLELLGRDSVVILGVAAALVLGKAAIMTVLAWLLVLPPGQSVRLGLLLSQGGEFAFVLLGLGRNRELLDTAAAQRLVAAVILTMMATPLLSQLGRRVGPRIERRRAGGRDMTPREPAGLQDHVIIAGFGRVGQSVAQRLSAKGIEWVALDLDPNRVMQARRRGEKVYFGDADRPEILDALDVGRARAVVVAIDNPRVALQLVGLLHYVLPELRILARAYDDTHAAELKRVGASDVVPEPAPLGAIIVDLLLKLPAAGDDTEEPG